MTIPPSRALLQQRDYRARKAQYLADLEVRVKKAEEENVVLRKELESLQAKLKAVTPPQAQSPYGPEVVSILIQSARSPSGHTVCEVADPPVSLSLSHRLLHLRTSCIISPSLLPR